VGSNGKLKNLGYEVSVWMASLYSNPHHPSQQLYIHFFLAVIEFDRNKQKKKSFSKIIFTVGIFCKIFDESSVIYRNTTNTEQRKVHVDDIIEILLMDEKEINEQYKCKNGCIDSGLATIFKSLPFEAKEASKFVCSSFSR
jgi:hypothetical protein